MRFFFTSDERKMHAWSNLIEGKNTNWVLFEITPLIVEILTVNDKRLNEINSLKDFRNN